MGASRQGLRLSFGALQLDDMHSSVRPSGDERLVSVDQRAAQVLSEFTFADFAVAVGHGLLAFAQSEYAMRCISNTLGLARVEVVVEPPDWLLSCKIDVKLVMHEAIARPGPQNLGEEQLAICREADRVQPPAF